MPMTVWQGQEGYAQAMPTPVDKPTEFKLFPEQQEAKDAFLEWFEGRKNGNGGIFRIFGYAGTGKTTIVKSIVQDIAGTKLFGAYTGKAALVMQRAGLPAKTIHSLIYKPVVPDKIAALRIRAEIDQMTEDNPNRKALFESLEYVSTMHFEMNDNSPLNECDLFILDECSMVNEEMANDIAEFNVPLLILGDPGQLPPISGTGALVRDEPDILLTKIHRQALDNPIIQLSFKARTGEHTPFADYGTSKKITRGMTDNTTLVEADQVLVGKNKTRLTLNNRIRRVLGYDKKYPVPGDKLICLRNNPKLNLFNGLICTVLEKKDEFDEAIEYRLEDEEGNEIICKIHKAYFEEYYRPGYVKSLPFWRLAEFEAFDFGYAITVHKSQGSQWDNVLLYDDGMCTWKGAEEDRKKWLYTGITRAAETITISQ